MISAGAMRRRSSAGRSAAAWAYCARARSAWNSSSGRKRAGAGPSPARAARQDLLPHAEARQVVQREVEPAQRGVRGDVAQDVDELERDAQLYRVFARARVVVLEDLDGGQAHRGGHALAVLAQLGEGRRSGVIVRSMRQPATMSSKQARGMGKRCKVLRQLLAQRRGRAPRVAAVDLLQPALEAGLALPAGLVHAVVHHAAEGVERVDGPALLAGQNAEGIVEVAPALARETRGDGACTLAIAQGFHRQARQARRALPSGPWCGRRRKTS